VRYKSWSARRTNSRRSPRGRYIDVSIGGTGESSRISPLCRTLLCRRRSQETKAPSAVTTVIASNRYLLSSRCDEVSSIAASEFNWLIVSQSCSCPAVSADLPRSCVGVSWWTSARNAFCTSSTTRVSFAPGRTLIWTRRLPSLARRAELLCTPSIAFSRVNTDAIRSAHPPGVLARGLEDMRNTYRPPPASRRDPAMPAKPASGKLAASKVVSRPIRQIGRSGTFMANLPQVNPSPSWRLHCRSIAKVFTHANGA